MASYKQMCMEYMRREKIRYEDVREFVLKITYTGANFSTIPIYIYFDEDGDANIAVKSWNVANFAGQRDAAIVLCNELNEKYRWVKFYVDEDADVVAELDAMIPEQNCGPVCMNVVRRVTSVVDDAYPFFMRELWGS